MTSRRRAKRALLLLSILGATAAVLCLFGASSAVEPDREEAEIDLRGLRPGDVILRRGRDLVSDVVLATDRESRFSHAGVVVQTGHLLGVAHVLPADSAYPKGVALTETLQVFASKANATEVAVLRLRGAGSGIAEAAARNALRYAKEKRPFDNRFSLATASELYCSELVWRAFLEAGVDLVDGRYRRLTLPVGPSDFVLPGSLVNSPHLKIILYTRTEK